MKDKLYVIAQKDDAVSDDNIFVVKAKDRDDALRKYAKDYLIKNKGFKMMVEDRAIKGSYGHYFYKDIYNFNMSEGYTTDLTADEISSKLKENINTYLGENQQYTEMLFDFYEDESKSIKDLDNELILILALKNVYEDLEYYMIKEVDI